jgi:hypothetical protein
MRLYPATRSQRTARIPNWREILGQRAVYYDDRVTGLLEKQA